MTKLSDLFVDVLQGAETPHHDRPARPATVADLVDAFIAEGGEIVEARQEERGWRPLMRVQEPGRWLVYGPIPVEEETP